jgi:hypothetical protein
MNYPTVFTVVLFMGFFWVVIGGINVLIGMTMLGLLLGFVGLVIMTISSTIKGLGGYRNHGTRKG